MSLSEKRYKSYEPEFHYKEKDVKEFIKEIKDFIIHDNFLNAQRKERARKRIIEKINKLAGPKLI